MRSINLALYNNINDVDRNLKKSKTSISRDTLTRVIRPLRKHHNNVIRGCFLRMVSYLPYVKEPARTLSLGHRGVN